MNVISTLKSALLGLKSALLGLKSALLGLKSAFLDLKKKPALSNLVNIFFLFSSYPLNSARIAHGQQVESKEFPNQWKNDPESHAQANLTLNTFAHETVDLSRFPNLILDNYEQDYLIQEDVKKPAEQFQSFHFHHASAGKNLNEYFFTNEQTNKQTNE